MRHYYVFGLIFLFESLMEALQNKVEVSWPFLVSLTLEESIHVYPHHGRIMGNIYIEKLFEENSNETQYYLTNCDLRIM